MTVIVYITYDNLQDIDAGRSLPVGVTEVELTDWTKTREPDEIESGEKKLNSHSTLYKFNRNIDESDVENIQDLYDASNKLRGINYVTINSESNTEGNEKIEDQSNSIGDIDDEVYNENNDISQEESSLNINEAFRTISPEKDVDGFNPVNVGKLVLNQDTFVSCTPYGIMKMFEEYNIDLTGKNVVILGRSNIVGKPLMHCCLNKNATVTVCHSKTQNLAQKAKEADILISAIGKAQFVTADMVKENAVVIDVGINRLENGKITGDVDFENVKEKASYITPVPGGVGPMTIAMLMNNVIKATKRQNGMID